MYNRGVVTLFAQTAQAAPLAAASDKLVQYGILGPIVLGLTYGIYRLWLQLQSSQETRITQAQTYADKQIAANERAVEMVSTIVRALDANTRALEAQTDALRRLEDKVEKRR